MKDCIFCKIVKGEIPGFKVYEDDNFLGFLDINPLSLGNSLLIPKNHYRWVYDIPNFGDYFEAAKKIALATMPIVNADTTSFLTLGYEVPHAHIRIIPRFEHDQHTHGIDTDLTINQNPKELEELAKKISDSVSRI